MLGLLLIYYIGQSFYKLAEEFGKSKWGFTILGVACYYGSGLIFGVILALIAPEFVDDLDRTSTFVIDLIAIPIGVGVCWMLRKLLRSQWEKSKVNDEQILDADLIN